MVGRRRRAVLRLAVLGGAISAAGAAEEACRPGFYRSAPIVFSCGGAEGVAHMLLPALSSTDAISLSEGVRFFSVLATGQSGGAGTDIPTPGAVEAELYDPAVGATVAAAQRGAANASVPLGEFRGVGVVFSRSAGSEENLYILGALPASLTLRFHNTLTTWAAVAMRYSHDGNEECPTTPSGCSVYDETFARSAVSNWSHWAQAEYSSPSEAWEKLGAEHARPIGESSEHGVQWYRWPAVFSGGADDLANAKPNLWQPAFHFIDADGDGAVSRREFEAGYAFYGSGAGSVGDLLAASAVVTTEIWISVVAALASLGIAGWMAWWWRNGKGKHARTVISRSVDLEYDDEQGFYEEKGSIYPRAGAPTGGSPPQAAPPFDGQGGSFSTGFFPSTVYSGGGPGWGSFWNTVQPLLPFGQGQSSSFRYGPVPSSEEPLSSRTHYSNRVCTEPLSRGAGMGMHMGGVGMQGQSGSFQTLQPGQSGSFQTLQPGNSFINATRAGSFQTVAPGNGSVAASAAGSLATAGGSFHAPVGGGVLQQHQQQHGWRGAARRSHVEVPIEPVAEARPGAPAGDACAPPAPTGDGSTASRGPDTAVAGGAASSPGADQQRPSNASKQQIDEVKKRILEKGSPGVAVFTPEDSGFYSGWARFVNGRRRLGQTTPSEASERDQSSRSATDNTGLPLLQWSP